MRKRIAMAGAALVLAAVTWAGMAGSAGDGPARPSAALGGLTTGATRHASAARSVGGDPATAQSQATLTAARPLAGKIIGIDPGHNGLNHTDPAYLNQLIWNGRAWEACDTTGTQTNGGYPEPLLTFRVAMFLRADLIRAGAKVVMTRTTDNGVGPCVDRRARILNRGHAVVSVDIHGDGGPSWGRGFSILEPVADGPNNQVIGSSARLARDIRAALLAGTPMPVSDYYGTNGLQLRSDLAGLNLTTEPKVLIECGNMRNSTDARLLTSTRFQQRLARAFTAAIVAFASQR